MSIGIIGIMAIVFGLDILELSAYTQEYDIFVDPIIDKQNLFVTGRITIQNTGSQPLTNIHVNFGAGDTLDIKTLKSGQKILLSPPSDNPHMPWANWRSRLCYARSWARGR